MSTWLWPNDLLKCWCSRQCTRCARACPRQGIPAVVTPCQCVQLVAQEPQVILPFCRKGEGPYACDHSKDPRARALGPRDEPYIICIEYGACNLPASRQSYRTQLWPGFPAQFHPSTCIGHPMVRWGVQRLAWCGLGSPRHAQKPSSFPRHPQFRPTLALLELQA